MFPFQLRSWERRQLLDLLDDPHDAKQVRRAQALVWLHEGQPVLRVAELLHVEPRTVYNWAYAFRERTDMDPLARLLDAPRSGRPPTALGIIDPLIDAVIADDPRSYGYRSTMWTASLLQRYLEEIHGIATSRKSVSRAIARLGIRWKQPRHRLGLRPDTWGQVKAGSKPAGKTVCGRSG
jgi:transposase